MTREEVLDYMRSAGVPVRLCDITRALNGDRRRVKQILNALEALKAVHRPTRGIYVITAEGQELDYPEIVQQGRNCPVTNGKSKHGKRAEQWVNPYGHLTTIAERIEAIAADALQRALVQE